MARPLLVDRSTMPALRARRHVLRSRAFTLVELAVVVTIVGVLAVIAVAGYQRVIKSSKLTEAENMLSSIRIAQEAYKVERGIYANVGNTPCPAGLAAGVKVQWAPSCNGGNMTWATLPVHSDGPVQFGYSTVAGPPGSPPTGGFVNVSAADLSKPWFVAMATADLNGDGASGLNTEVWTSSFGNQIFSRNVGE